MSIANTRQETVSSHILNELDSIERDFNARINRLRSFVAESRNLAAFEKVAWEDVDPTIVPTTEELQANEEMHWLELKAMPAYDALFWIFYHAERKPMERDLWMSSMEKAGKTADSANRVRMQMVKDGLLVGHYGTYELTEKAEYYRLVLKARDRDMSQAVVEGLEEYEKNYGHTWSWN